LILPQVKLKRWEEASAAATEAIERNDQYSKAFALRGQARVHLKNWEDACVDYEKASELAPDSTEFKASLAEARRQRKLEDRIDLYSLLNLSRSDAHEITSSKIKKAYHKQALVWHPDKHSNNGPEGKKVAEHKFKAIGRAYAILSEPNKKQRYDRGASAESLEGENAVDESSFSGGFAGGYPRGSYRRSAGYQRRGNPFS